MEISTVEIGISLIDLQELYVESLNPKQRKALKIAQEHLGSTYNMIKSNGFIRFKKEREIETILPTRQLVAP